MFVGRVEKSLAETLHLEKGSLRFSDGWNITRNEETVETAFSSSTLTFVCRCSPNRP